MTHCFSEQPPWPWGMATDWIWAASWSDCVKLYKSAAKMAPLLGSSKAHYLYETSLELNILLSKAAISETAKFWNTKDSNFLASKTYPYRSFGKNNSAILAVADEDGLSQPDKCTVWGTQGCCSYELCTSFKKVTPPVLPELLETAFSSLSSRVSFWHNCQLMRGGTRG